jgi:hypothetical protein
MKKITFVLVTAIVSLMLFSSCKKDKDSDTPTPTLTLAVSSNTFGAINSCNWVGNGQTNVGTPFNISFAITDPNKILQSSTWQLFEQIGTQAAVLVTPTPALSNNTFSKSGGCVTFGPLTSFPAKYYVVCNGTTSNTVSVTVNKPAGAF